MKTYNATITIKISAKRENRLHMQDDLNGTLALIVEEALPVLFEKDEIVSTTMTVPYVSHARDR